MEDFGYKESLDRSIGKFASFAAGVSYISILTGTFQLFYFGFGTAGPAYLWSWPIVFVGQMAVALCFMELAAKYPVAGSVYNWSKKLASRLVGWMSGWLMLTASIVTISAVALAYQLNLPRLWSGFQIIGDGTGDYDYAANAVLLGTVLIVFTTLINALGVKLMSRINSAGVFIELIAAVLIVILLAINVERGPKIFFSTNGYGAGESMRLPRRVPDRLAGVGLRDVRIRHRQLAGRGDGRTAAHRAQGDRPGDPGVVRDRRRHPGVRGDGRARTCRTRSSARARGGLQYIVEQVMWGPLGTIFLICIVIAVTVCTLAVHTAAIRLTFAMARDNALPFGEKLATVNPKTQTPIVPAVTIGVIAVIILVVNIGQPKIFTVLTSIAIIMIYLAYLMVTGPLLKKRLQGQWPPADLKEGGYFTMGTLGAAGQHRRRGVGRRHGAEPGLAARRGLRRALVQHLGRVRLHRRRSSVPACSGISSRAATTSAR